MSHNCFMPRCDRPADPAFAVCGACYRVLPEDKRFAITRAFIRDMTVETMTAGMRYVINEASAWMTATFGDEPREKHDPGRWERLVRYVREKDEARRVRQGKETKLEELDPKKPPMLRLVR